jgi:hypothetical protein
MLLVIVLLPERLAWKRPLPSIGRNVTLHQKRKVRPKPRLCFRDNPDPPHQAYQMPSSM